MAERNSQASIKWPSMDLQSRKEGESVSDLRTGVEEDLRSTDSGEPS